MNNLNFIFNIFKTKKTFLIHQKNLQKEIRNKVIHFIFNILKILFYF
jgi:hypothetical protein